MYRLPAPPFPSGKVGEGREGGGGVCTQANNYFNRAMCSRSTLFTGSLKIKGDYLRNVSRFLSFSGYHVPFSLNALSTPMDFQFHVPADCDQICTNTPGSYSCSCVGGYQLSSDAKSCEGESLDKTLVIVIAVCCRSTAFLGPKNMHTYPDIFESATFFLRIRRLPSIRTR